MKYSQALLVVCVGGVALAAAAPFESNDAEMVARKFAFRTPRFGPKLSKNRGVGLNSVSRPVDSIPISETPQTESTKAIRELTDDDLLYLRGLEDNRLEARKTIAQLIRELRNKFHPRPAPTLTPEPTSTPAPAQRVQESGSLGNEEVVERDVRRCATKVRPYSTKSDSTASVGKATSAIAGRNLMDDDLLDLRSIEDDILEERSLAEFRAKVRAMQPSRWKPQPLVPSAASSPVQRDLELVVRAIADMFEVNDLD